MGLKPFEIDEILKTLYEHFRNELTPFESEFVGSLQTQWALRQHLSEKQERVLERIWEGFASGRRHRALGTEPDTDPGDR